MDKREKLIEIIKNAKLPHKAEEALLTEVNSQTDISDEFIVDVADILDRIGIYLQTVGEIELENLDEIIGQAQKVGGAYEILASLEEQLQPARESLQMFTASAKPTV